MLKPSVLFLFGSQVHLYDEAIYLNCAILSIFT